MSFLSGRTSLTTVQTGDLADNAVTLGKMAGGTDGNILGYDANGDPEAIATGSAGEVLTSGGAGVASAMAAAADGGWVFVENIEASASSTILCVDQNIVAGYDYLVVWEDLLSTTGDADLIMKFGTGATPTILSSGYEGQTLRALSTTVTGKGAESSQVDIIIAGGGAAGAAEKRYGSAVIYNPAAAEATAFRHECFYSTTNGSPSLLIGGGWQTGTAAITAIRFHPNASTIATGSFTTYRRKRT